jgi:hypothetical protein
MPRASDGFAAPAGERWLSTQPHGGATPGGSAGCWKTSTPIGNLGAVVGRIESR